ncbi:DUF1028 domain-containing protein [Tropicimonas sp. IMCC6043]|uniref:DUF1028 domain-containing protein n=1 Tax=Tropicimonas sp. IMCC6043 TaxID=2510645 RepID=UPI00101C8C20|nr:DUF1028 domain-containing protein [Tropicimonas sp. IMCC6043]RYH11554.1 DUF1028 domain-containing protein [Tropicimonas sp. IMCC6043]
MTFSLLARDPETGAFGGAAVTGNLCVGAWVLRGDARFGLSASQGHTPSTLWGEDTLAHLAGGASAGEALSAVVGTDPGRETRQLAVLDRHGATAVHDGADNLPFTGHLAAPGWVVAGNWLASSAVIERAAETFAAPGRPFADRLVAALRAGMAAGSDRRGTFSAALLVLAEDAPPLDLRVDFDAAPVDRLADLLDRTRATGYAAWLDTLPTRRKPFTT